MEDFILDDNVRNPNPNFKTPLPNATATLVLGILSIVTCFCYGIIGIILGTIALVISKKPLEMYRENPEAYTQYPNLQAGRICAIVGVSLSAIYFLIIAVYLAFLGTMLTSSGMFPFDN